MHLLWLVMELNSSIPICSIKGAGTLIFFAIEDHKLTPSMWSLSR